MAGLQLLLNINKEVKRFEDFGNADHGDNLTSVAKIAAIRDTAERIFLRHWNVRERISFNLTKSEILVWIIDRVDYLETVARMEVPGASYRLSIRVASGVYCWTGTFSSLRVECEETVHRDTQMSNSYLHKQLKMILFRDTCEVPHIGLMRNR